MGSRRNPATLETTISAQRACLCSDIEEKPFSPVIDHPQADETAPEIGGLGKDHHQPEDNHGT